MDRINYHFGTKIRKLLKIKRNCEIYSFIACIPVFFFAIISIMFTKKYIIIAFIFSIIVILFKLRALKYEEIAEIYMHELKKMISPNHFNCRSTIVPMLTDEEFEKIYKSRFIEKGGNK